MWALDAQRGTDDLGPGPHRVARRQCRATQRTVEFEALVTTWMDGLILSHEPEILGAMQLRYRYRFHPTPAQRKALARAFGCARVVYNDGLRLREEAYKAGLPWVSRLSRFP